MSQRTMRLETHRLPHHLKSGLTALASSQSTCAYWAKSCTLDTGGHQPAALSKRTILVRIDQLY